MLSCDVLLGRLVDLVKYPAVAKELRLSFFPAAEVIDRGERQLGEAGDIGGIGCLRLDRTVEVLGGDLLALIGIEVVEISLRDLAGAFLVDIAVNDSDRRVGAD